ncbi:hypothetical protein K523DRAFT_322800 [Schizophyllum commune Tattone D]|nr:hypothetical protein K523DRAFT_322800 [Schizophyllum commune Tattone D]
MRASERRPRDEVDERLAATRSNFSRRRERTTGDDMDERHAGVSRPPPPTDTERHLLIHAPRTCSGFCVTNAHTLSLRGFRDRRLVFRTRPEDMPSRIEDIPTHLPDSHRTYTYRALGYGDSRTFTPTHTQRGCI